MTGIFARFSIITPVYNFFNKKNAAQGFLLYNEFDQNITKDSDPVRQTYYTMKNFIGRLYHYFYKYFETCSTPTAQTLILLLLSIVALESADSIRFLYRHFLSKLTDKSLNAFYYACSYAKVDYSRFMNVTASMTLKLIPNL